jgi:hypothetical protein
MKYPVELTEEECSQFRMFQEHFALFKILNDRGIFDIRSGSCTIHFSRLGEIVSVEKTEHYITNILA